MKLGISTYALTWSIGVEGYPKPEHPLTATDILEVAQNLKVDVVQFADNLPLHSLDSHVISKIVNTAQSFGLQIEIGTRGTNVEHLLHYLRIAQIMNSKIVRTIINDPNLEHVNDEIARVLPQFSEADVVLAVENHGQQTVSDLANIFERYSTPYLGCCLDTVNSFGALEGYNQVVNTLSPYVVNLHVKDFEIVRENHKMGFVIKGTPTGEGQLDVPRLLHTIKQRGKDPTAVVELWTPYLGTISETVKIENKWLNRSVSYLQAMDEFARR